MQKGLTLMILQEKTLNLNLIQIGCKFLIMHIE